MPDPYLIDLREQLARTERNRQELRQWIADQHERQEEPPKLRIPLRVVFFAILASVLSGVAVSIVDHACFR